MVMRSVCPKSPHVAVSPTVKQSSVCHLTKNLAKDSGLGLTYVNCELREGMAILHGRVSSFYHKQLAQEIVKRAKGVESVMNRIEVAQAPERNRYR